MARTVHVPRQFFRLKRAENTTRSLHSGQGMPVSGHRVTTLGSGYQCIKSKDFGTDRIGWYSELRGYCVRRSAFSSV